MKKKLIKIEDFKIEDSDEVITCRICGRKMAKLYGSHLTRAHKLTKDEYMNLYPNAPMISKNADAVAKEVGKNSHMKQDKYKQMFREKIMGANNPNSCENTTEEQRKSRSPFSKDFCKYTCEEDRQNFIDSVDFVSNTQVSYYTERGHTEEEAKLLISERQRTFSLKKCIENYGEEKGHKVFTERQNKWQHSLNTNGNLKCGYSGVSQELFDAIMPYYKTSTKDVYYATKNNELKLDRHDAPGLWLYDFADTNKRKIIEYHGDIYHANPGMYEATDTPSPFRRNIPAVEIWKSDERKLETANNECYDVLVIWDSEYNANKKQTIKKCIKFLGL